MRDESDFFRDIDLNRCSVADLLRGKARELGIDPKPERSIAKELTATLTRERTRAFDMGI